MILRVRVTILINLCGISFATADQYELALRKQYIGKQSGSCCLTQMMVFYLWDYPLLNRQINIQSHPCLRVRAWLHEKLLWVVVPTQTEFSKVFVIWNKKLKLRKWPASKVANTHFKWFDAYFKQIVTFN